MGKGQAGRARECATCTLVLAPFFSLHRKPQPPSPGHLIPTRTSPLFGKGEPMLPAKTLVQRATELQSLLATPAGRKELAELEARYPRASGRVLPASTQIITCILCHEREAGLIGI